MLRHLGWLQLEVLHESKKRAKGKRWDQLNPSEEWFWKLVDDKEVVASVAGFDKDVLHDLHGEATNQGGHGDQCEEQSEVSSIASKVGESKQEICEHKLGRHTVCWRVGFGWCC